MLSYNSLDVWVFTRFRLALFILHHNEKLCGDFFFLAEKKYLSFPCLLFLFLIFKLCTKWFAVWICLAYVGRSWCTLHHRLPWLLSHHSSQLWNDWIKHIILVWEENFRIFPLIIYYPVNRYQGQTSLDESSGWSASLVRGVEEKKLIIVHCFFIFSFLWML